MEDLKRCPYCAEEIQAAAVLCKHCHSSLTDTPLLGAPNIAPQQKIQTPQAPQVVITKSPPSPGIAFLIGLIVPGGGLIYAGFTGIGVALLIMFACTCWLGIGFIFWLIGLVVAPIAANIKAQQMTEPLKTQSTSAARLDPLPPLTAEFDQIEFNKPIVGIQKTNSFMDSPRERAIGFGAIAVVGLLVCLACSNIAKEMDPVKSEPVVSPPAPNFTPPVAEPAAVITVPSQSDQQIADQTTIITKKAFALTREGRYAAARIYFQQARELCSTYSTAEDRQRTASMFDQVIRECNDKIAAGY